MVIGKPSIVTRRSSKARLRTVVGTLLGPGLLLAAGCGQGTEMPEVAGTVTVDGALIDEGTIRFVSLDRKGPTAGTMIRAGKYRVAVPVGRKRVQIEAFRPGGSPRHNTYPGMADMQSTVQFLPARYNVETRLGAEITADAEKRPLDFELKSH